jgi:hypothetical protein
MSDRKSSVSEVFDIVCGQSPLSNANHLIEEDVILFIDNDQFVGLNYWKYWVKYLHSNLRGGGVTAKIHQEDLGESIRVIGKFLNYKEEGSVDENNIVVEFFFQGEKICKIVSKKSNYTSILGNSIIYKPVFLLHLFKIALFQRIS